MRVIAQQQAEIDRLREEINRLKGLPRRPTIRPSTLNAPHPDPSHKKRRRGKRPGSAKRKKTGELTIHEIIPVPIKGLPAGTSQNGYEDFVVQDLRVEAHNVCAIFCPTGRAERPRCPRTSAGISGPRCGATSSISITRTSSRSR